MPIVEYTSDLFDALQEMVVQIPCNMNLAHRPFVDYYYATRCWCKLYLFLSDSGRVLGTIGRELVRFEYDSREITIRLGSNWFSLRPGIGGQLTNYSAQANPGSFSMTLMMSRQAREIHRHHGWVHVPGVTGYFLNGCSLFPWDSWWKKAGNLGFQRFLGNRITNLTSRIPCDVRAEVTICEESSYSPDLLPSRSPFRFRPAPTIAYLDWRYNLSLSFVRYRLFRIWAGGASIGYVILNDSPRQIIVSQCDGEDATKLAYGVLLSILQVGEKDERPRLVFLSCCHAEMRRVFEQFGFRPRLAGDLPFGFRVLPPDVDPSGIANWLVNYDWSDNGLQAPFLDQPAVP